MALSFGVKQGPPLAGPLLLRRIKSVACVNWRWNLRAPVVKTTAKI